MYMKKWTLLVVDRNPYIRSFLQRELSAEGYEVGLATNGCQTMEWVGSNRSLDLIIIDPDLPDEYGAELIHKLHAIIPNLPIVVHTLFSASQKYHKTKEVAACIEKSGGSIEQLKAVVSKIVACLQAERTWR